MFVLTAFLCPRPRPYRAGALSVDGRRLSVCPSVFPVPGPQVKNERA